MTKTTFGFIKDPSSTLHSLGALDGTTPIAVEHDKIVDAVSNVFTKLIATDDPMFKEAILNLESFAVTFINNPEQPSSLIIESDNVVIELKILTKKTAALFLNAINPPQKSGVEWVVEAFTYLVSRLVDALTSVFTTRRHFTKWTKYRLIQERLAQFAHKQNVEKLKNSPTHGEIITTWNALLEALHEPTHFKTPDKQYRKTVECLCTLRRLLSDKRTQEKFAVQLEFVRKLSRKLFTGIKLFPYCRQLIEIGSGKMLPPVLTMDTFLEEFKDRATIFKKPLGSTAMNWFAKIKHMLNGTMNWSFAPLLKTSNIPYRDGVITANDRSTLMLWHGTPVEQHDFWGSMADLLAGALSYIPYVGDWIGDSNPLTSPPVINDHYIAFIEGAKAKNKNILHVILENGKKKRFGDESGRVKARLKLNEHENFFPIALNLDGKFFERHDLAPDQAEPIGDLKTRLKTKLLSPLIGADDVAQMEDQLAKTGFCIPQKLRDASQLEDNIDRLLQEVQDIYFPGKENIMTQEEHQAFLILSYVHIILFICWKMDIKILGALCKDDKDRGNVIKTILKLHFLYITGKINHENLTSVLTHALARPFILQKAPIVKSRLDLLVRVIPFVKDAYKQVRDPKTTVFGAAVANASYVVDKPLNQTIYPNNATSKTIGEYRTFLKKHRPIRIPLHKDNSIRELVLNDQRLDTTIEQKTSDATTKMLLAHLNSLFANPELGITVKLESKGLNRETSSFEALFSISNETTNFSGIKVSRTNDLKTGQAQFEYSLVSI